MEINSASDDEKDPYLPDDENLFIDDEDDEESVETLEGVKPGFDVSESFEKGSEPLKDDLISKALEKLGFSENNEVEKVEFIVREFPEEYRFLLKLPAINENALREYPDLFDLLLCDPQTISQMIDKQVAVVCLYWAQGIIDCSHPLLKKVKLKLQDAMPIRSKVNPRKQFLRIRFYVECGKDHMGREPKKGMIVIFRTKEERRISTRISKIEGRKYYFVLRTEMEDSQRFLRLEEEIVDVFEVPQEFIPVSMIRSIEELKTGFLNHILCPQPNFSEKHYQYLERKETQMKKFMKKYDVSDQLTEAQQDAIFAICNKEHGENPFVLFGPPGTGKTFVISEAIQTFLKMKSTNRVLVCTPSNMAADHVAEQLMKDFGGILTEKNVLRLRSLGNNYYVRDQKFDKIISCDPDKEIYTIPESFTEYRVVICTLGCSTYLVNTQMLTGFFNAIIIDEGGQCSEPELWIPLGGLATQETSIILCGDPKQLGPVITLDLSNPMKKKFVSPLIRYMDIQKYNSDKRLCCQLVNCFRCHRSLVGIVSVLFYESRLLPMSPEHVDFDLTALEMKSNFPILFVSVYGDEKLQPGGTSHANFMEADVCLEYASYFIEKHNVEPEQVGIISPYTYQTKVIVERASKRRNSQKFRSVTVSSVEKFQGSEREIIIISGTRTKSLGFMADDLRVNTSLTRAKKVLIVVGNEQLLKQHDSWRRFIAYCQHNNSFKVWNQGDQKFATEDLNEGFELFP